MTDASIPTTGFVESDFRVGRVLGRTSSVLKRNFLIFFVVTAIATLPMYLVLQRAVGDPLQTSQLKGLGIFVALVLTSLSQAIVVYGAFQDMLGRRVDLGQSVQVGLRRFFPILGLAISVTLLGILGLIALLVPGLILLTRWFVAMPACVVEELGVSSSMRRSAQLTKGHRWKIFGVMLVLLIADAIANHTIDLTLSSIANGYPALAGHVIWGGIWDAFYAIFAVVTYHDLRVAKEGVDTVEIAAVFE
ncbi:MAG TPA: glycerophosphoryl diester phosphodiesterase membrane domain-containing protein [Xanthobacteraceae bacterium]